MQALYRTLLLVATLMGLSGCFVTTKEIIVTKVNTVYITAPQELLLLPRPEAPLRKDAYMALTLPEREVYLAGYSIALLKEVKICSANLARIKQLQEAHIESQPPDQTASE